MRYCSDWNGIYIFNLYSLIINLKNQLNMRTKVKVQQMESPRSGRPVANQFIIYTNKGSYFQSYKTIIAFRERHTGKTFLDSNYWDYSRTTSRYRNEFLNETTKETRQRIKDKEYKLKDLN